MIAQFKFKFKLYCDRRSFGQFVLVSCPFWSGWLDCISLSDNYFLSFPCRAPSLTSGRVYNLQWNEFRFMFRLFYDRQSVLVSDPHRGFMTRFLLLSDIFGHHVERRPPWRKDGSVIYTYNFLSLFGPRPTYGHGPLRKHRSYVTVQLLP
jgi:hypothetical protein